MKTLGDDIIINDSHILTEKEQIVLFGLADGKTPTQIKSEIDCDNMLLRNIETNLMIKLNAKSKTHLITRAFSLGLLVTRTLCIVLILTQTTLMFNSNANAWTRINRIRTTRISRPITRKASS